jgi:hypothetical protein
MLFKFFRMQQLNIKHMRKNIDIGIHIVAAFDELYLG